MESRNRKHGSGHARLARKIAWASTLALMTVGIAAVTANAEDVDDNPPGPVGGEGTNWENQPGPQGGPGASPDRRRPQRPHDRFDRDNNPPGHAGGPGTNWENRPGPQGGPGASPDRRGGNRRPRRG